MATFSTIGSDLPSISSIMNFTEKLDLDLLDVKKKQLLVKFNNQEITKTKYNELVDDLELKPVYSTSSIPENVDKIWDSPMSLTPNLIRQVVTFKPILVEKSDMQRLGRLAKVVAFNQSAIEENIYDKSFSPKIINWVEPYDIKGFNKTLFYTEVNSGLKLGDRVFIVGGNYDSGTLIKNDKYKKGRDGYKILYIENCKIVLDIDYTGVLPYNEDENDNFIKVHYVRDFSEFIQVNRELTTRNGVLDNKFSYYQNNIAYFASGFSPISFGWGDSNGISTPGFYVRNSSTSPANWTNITDEFLSGSFSYALSPTYNNNNKIKVLNGDFLYNDILFQDNYVYKWEVGPTQSSWVVDVTYRQPFVTKGNFRNGNFNGKWNTGLFGRNDKRTIWDGDGSTWESGTLLNSIWKNGKFNSKYSLKESFYSDFDIYGIPFQKANLTNNNGRGFNFIIDSEINNITLDKSTVKNTIFGTQSRLFSVVENHIISATTSFNINLNSSFVDNSFFYNSIISKSEIGNSRILNSKLSNSKVINSKLKESVIKDSTFLSDDIIKILGYDEWSASEYNSNNPEVTNKIYKFYISKNDYERLKNRDYFYIKGINVKNNSKEVLNHFDKKFILSSWTEYVDGLVSYEFKKVGIESVAYLSTPLDNQYRITSVGLTSSIVDLNNNSKYSVDIIMKTIDIFGGSNIYNFNRDSSISSPSSPTMSNYIGDIIDISNAYIIDSDFESGVIETSNWVNGNNINPNNSLSITKNTNSGGYYDISIGSTSSSTINVKTSYNPLYPDGSSDIFSVGNVVFLNSVYHEVKNYVTGLSVLDGGTDYITLSSVSTQQISGSNGIGLLINIDAPNGTVSNVEIAVSGYSYSVGDVLRVLDGNTDARVVVTSVTSSINLLPTDFKIISNSSGNLTLKEIIKPGTSSVFNKLQLYGDFYTPDAQNRYGYLYKSKFYKTKVKSGIFRRTLFDNCIIENDDYNSSDKDYLNMNRVRNLVISDCLFKDKMNVLSNATYIYSNFVKGPNVWVNGIIQKSIWNGLSFSNGTIKESRWVDGTFNSGLFYGSKSFNANPSVDEYMYNIENTLSYYKDGLTTVTISNDRYSWQKGLFRLNNKSKTSEFYKSDWENGKFEDGKFYYSKWYDGLVSGGIFGDKSLDVNDTLFYNGTVSNVVVENASFYASDTSYSQSNKNSIYWYDGIFNDGLFGTNFLQKTASNTATWYNGSFNGGQFDSMAKWKNGNFNGGKFISGYGWTLSNSTYSLDYGWESGIFNNGEFGNANGLTNSTWWTGEFNNGTFKGRVWNNGIFEKGEFKGSATVSSVGGLESGNANLFVDSFRSEFYGLWRDGFFAEEKDKLIKDQKIWSPISRNVNYSSRKIYSPSKMTNALWLNGTFSHQSGEMNNVVWLNGEFDKGKFSSGSFNPFVRRNTDKKNVWSYDQQPESIYNGSFKKYTISDVLPGQTLQQLNGWTESSMKSAIYGMYYTFSLVDDMAVFISEIKQPLFTGIIPSSVLSRGLEFRNTVSNITSGSYQVSLDIVTFSSDKMDISIVTGTTNSVVNLIKSVTDKNIGFNTFNINLLDGQIKLFVTPNGQTGSLTIDNLSIKKIPDSSFNFDDSCIWNYGDFNNSDFHISKWKNGNFLVGTAYGMIWQSGISNYMNAFNVFWEDGLWRNGNWYGSAIEFDGEIENGFNKQILLRGMSWSGTSSCHIWNVFESVDMTTSGIFSTASNIYLDTSVENPILFIPDYFDNIIDNIIDGM